MKIYFNTGIKVLFFIFFIFFIVTSCGLLTGFPVNTESASEVRAGDSAQTNMQYVERLNQDGWPAEKLNTAKNADYLTDIEKNMVLAHNLIRYNPERYADLYVTEYIEYYQGREFHYPGHDVIMMTREGVSPARELYRELSRTEPLPLLYPSEKLSAAARSHAEYQGQTGETGHDGQGGMLARIEREGEWENTIGENIAYGNWSAHDAIMGLMIDDGVPDRGHRINILEEDFRVIGVAHDFHPQFEGGVYVINYAGGFEDVKPDL